MTVQELLKKFPEPNLNMEIRSKTGERVYHGRANTLTETILNYDATRVVLVVEVEKKKPDLPEYERR